MQLPAGKLYLSIENFSIHKFQHFIFFYLSNGEDSSFNVQAGL